MSISSIIIDANGYEAIMKTKKQGIQMYQPGHPGEVIREACLKPLGLSVTAAAEGLGVTRKTLSELLNGHSGVSPEMALRLAAAGWSTAETWLEMQLAYDLWQVRTRIGELHVKQFITPEAA